MWHRPCLQYCNVRPSRQAFSLRRLKTATENGAIYGDEKHRHRHVVP